MASFVSIAKDFLLLVKGELDQHTTEKSNIKVNNFLSVSIFTPAHVQFAAYGRAKSIGKNGTKNYVSNAPNVIEEVLEKHLQFYANRLNNNHIEQTIKKLDERYKKDLKQIKVSL